MAGRNVFSFKRFDVDQTGCAMKVGTDGVLLGAWCDVRPGRDEAILDIGTGTGLIALMLAQRTESFSDVVIDAVETDFVACAAAQRNFEASEWSKRLVAHAMSAQQFAREATAAVGFIPVPEPVPRKYDHIVSNPPWFTDSLLSPDVGRTMARHTGELSYEELISVCDRLLKPDGRVSLILPAGGQTDKMIAIAASVGFAVSRFTEVWSTPTSGPKRSMIEFVRQIAVDFPRESQSLENAPTHTPYLTIQESGAGPFTEEYRALTRDFYLHF
jgi:tRNA1Val (adenine37-N6)-methyltransferase